MKITLKSEIPLKGNYDIVVCGGGIAGVAAALQAARVGKKVMLIEKSQKLGGLATLGLINFFVPMCNGRGRQIIFGMAEEFLRLSIEKGYDTIPENWQDEKSSARYCTKYSAEIFALELTKLLTEIGVTLMFDSIVTDAVYNNGVCEGVVIENKSGKGYYTANMFIEATGDCDLLRRIGIPTLKRGNYHTYLGQMISLNSCKKAVDDNNIKYAITGVNGGRISLYGTNQPADIPLYDGTDADEVNRYLINNQLEMLKNIENDDRNSREIVTIPGMAQFRTTACLDANYVLKGEDAYLHFDDSIAAINDFDRNDYLYEIPYGTLVRDGVKNIIATGRCAAGDGWGWDVLRVIPPAIITGQAAGFATAIAIDDHKDITDIDITKLQKRLADANVLIHFDDAWVPETSDNTFSNIEETNQ